MPSGRRADRCDVRRLGSGPLIYALVAAVVICLGLSVYEITNSGSRSSSPSVVLRPPAKPGSVPRGDHAGVVLLGQVREAYAKTPAVVITGGTPALAVSFTLVLHNGVAVAEAFTGSRAAHQTVLVKPQNQPTFAHDPGTSCWRALAPSNRQSLTDVGERFPAYSGSSSVGAPVRAQQGWLLTLTAPGTSSTLSIDASTHLVRTIAVTGAAGHLTEHVQTPASAPPLPAAQPRC